MRLFVSQSRQLQEIILIDVQGTVLLSTDTNHEGEVLIDDPSFIQGIQGFAVRINPFQETTTEGELFIFLPIYDHDGTLMGSFLSTF